MLQRHLKYDINTASFDRGKLWWQGILYSGGWISSSTVCAVTKPCPERRSPRQQSFDQDCFLVDARGRVGRLTSAGHSLTLWNHYLQILTAHLANCCRTSNNFSDVTTAQGSFLTPDGHKFQDGKIFRGTIASQENDVKLLP